MSQISDLLLVSDAFCAATGMGRKRLSTLMLQRGARLDELAGGGDLGTRTWAKAMRWLSDNWPDDVEWPEGVKRPYVEAAE